MAYNPFGGNNVVYIYILPIDYHLKPTPLSRESQKRLREEVLVTITWEIYTKRQGHF